MGSMLGLCQGLVNSQENTPIEEIVVFGEVVGAGETSCKRQD